MSVREHLQERKAKLQLSNPGLIHEKHIWQARRVSYLSYIVLQKDLCVPFWMFCKKGKIYSWKKKE